MKTGIVACAIALALICAATAYISYLRSSLSETREELAQARIIVAGQAGVIKNQDNDLEAYENTFELFREQREQDARQAGAWRREIQRSRESSPSFESWHSGPLPAELMPGGGLRENRAGGAGEAALPVRPAQ